MDDHTDIRFIMAVEWEDCLKMKLNKHSKKQHKDWRKVPQDPFLSWTLEWSSREGPRNDQDESSGHVEMYVGTCY